MTYSTIRLACRSALSIALLLAGCGALPTSGPSNDQVLNGTASPKNPLGIRLVDLTPTVVSELRNRPERSLSVIDRLRSNVPVDRLGPGDVLQISIYEAGNGLFSVRRTTPNDTDSTPTGSSAEALPRLQIDRNGMVMVPYAGEVHVGGLTTTQVQRLIESKLADKASQAQVLVSLASNGSNVVYISGDVKIAGRYPLSLAHEKLLDIIALAGGPTHSPQDTLVKVSRRGQEATTTLTRVQTIPTENIPVEPLDRIQVDYLPRSYLSFGATGRVAQISFDAADISLAEAVARVGGLDDNRANPEAVFLFRYERPTNLETLGVIPPNSAPPLSSPVTPGAMPSGTPIVYKVNMRDPQSFFAIQQFSMQDKDLIYIANAPTVQLYKFLSLIYTFTTPALSAKAAFP